MALLKGSLALFFLLTIGIVESGVVRSKIPEADTPKDVAIGVDSTGAVDLSADSKEVGIVRHRKDVSEPKTTASFIQGSDGEAIKVGDINTTKPNYYMPKKYPNSFVETMGQKTGQRMKGADACGCFPGSAEVLLEDGSSRRVSELQQGDMLMTFQDDGSVSYSPFVLDFHNANNILAQFVEITTDAKKALRATPNHLIRSLSAGFVRAGDVKVGDEILTKDGAAKVLGVRMVDDVSIHSPLTQSGRLIVDGYAVSSYSLREGEVKAMRAVLGDDVDVHAVSHAMEFPVLALYRSGIPALLTSLFGNVVPSPTEVAWTWNIDIISNGVLPALKMIF